MLKFDQLNLWYMNALTIDFIVIIVLIWSLRTLKSWLFGVKAIDEIATKDNIAFGVAYSGSILALSIMLTGASAGKFADTLIEEAISMSVFGALGVLLILGGRLIQDKLVMRNVSIHEQIKQGNLAAGVVDVGNMVAVGIIVRGVMLWVQTEGYASIPVILCAWLISQLVLALASRYRVTRFANVASEGGTRCLQTAFEQGNVGLAIRYMGYITGTALAITAASGFVEYSADKFWLAALIWGAVSLGFAVVFAVIVLLVRLVILPGVDVDEEVDKQKNTGVASLEAAIFIAVGLSLANLFG